MDLSPIQTKRATEVWIEPTPKPKRPGTVVATCTDNKSSARVELANEQNGHRFVKYGRLPEAHSSHRHTGDVDSCPGTDWNAIAPAPALSQLAGVLAGFVFTGIIVLLSQYKLSRSSIRTLSIFVATFIVLGLDSYDFALLTGEPNVSTGCSRYWTQSLLASGLLGLGAVLLVSGVVWLVSAYYYSELRFDTISTSPGSDLRRLENLAKSILYGVTAVVTVGIVSTATDYLNVTFSGSPPRWLLLASVIYPVIILLTILGLRTYRRHRQPDRDLHGAMTVGTIGSVIYAVTATIVDGIAVTFPHAYWNPVPTWVAIGAFGIALLMPAPTLVVLIYTVPRLDHHSGKTLSPELPSPRSKPTESTHAPQSPAKFFAGTVLIILIVVLRRVSARL